MIDLTAFQRDVLIVLYGNQGSHGLAIKDDLEEYYRKEINHGHLYPNLDTLADKGLIDKQQEDHRTNSYSITRRGYRDLSARKEWEWDYLDEKVKP